MLIRAAQDRSERERRPALTTFFAGRTRYCEVVYAAQEEETSFRDFHIVKRKASPVRLFAEYAKGRPLGVLDIGCGPSVTIAELLRCDYSVVSGDIGREMLERAL